MGRASSRNKKAIKLKKIIYKLVLYIVYLPFLHTVTFEFSFQWALKSNISIFVPHCLSLYEMFSRKKNTRKITSHLWTMVVINCASRNRERISRSYWFNHKLYSRPVRSTYSIKSLLDCNMNMFIKPVYWLFIYIL
jgi:hypothetical protein